MLRTVIGNLLVGHCGVAFDDLAHGGWPDLVASKTLRDEILLVCFVGVQLVHIVANHQGCVGHALRCAGCSKVMSYAAKHPASFPQDFPVLDDDGAGRTLSILLNDWDLEGGPVGGAGDVTHDGVDMCDMQRVKKVIVGQRRERLDDK